MTLLLMACAAAVSHLVSLSCYSLRQSVPIAMAATSRGHGVTLITGGTGGIGLATARLLAARGDDLVLAYGGDNARAEAACQELQEVYGVRAFAVCGDLTSDHSRDATVDKVFALIDGELGGKVSAFVHAAGFFHTRLLEHHIGGAVTNFTVYDQYQSIYPKAFVGFAEGCITRMENGHGRVVCVTNPGCNAMQIPRVGYDMPGQGKATMEFLVRMYALRLAQRGLCVNAVSPGYTDTKEWDKARMTMGHGDLEAGRRALDQRVLSRSPMKRWAAPAEIAQTIAFLCAEQSGLITGAFIPVDGGLHLA
mmetsp:Transcript_19681/g.32804  ORF Transcript_19681/g.32804 Transcript_19681/m.32804 type:complete len:308 (+) Transcript_19681:3-926(+)